MANKTKSYNFENSTTVGPWGGKLGSDWVFKPNGGIKEIKLSYNGNISSISFISIDENGIHTSSPRFGRGGGTEKVISFNWPKEYLTNISGTYDKQIYIKSLCFRTNVNTYGPFGPTGGTPFEFSSKDVAIVGFYGRSGVVIDAIGCYVKNTADLFPPPLPPLPPPNQLQTFTPKVNNEIQMNKDEPRELGPWGGNTAKPWDDGVFLAINQFDVHVKNGIVVAIQLQYQSIDCKSVESEKHGQRSGDTIYRIKLDSAKEYLTGIMGYYRPIEGNGNFEALCSLTLYTNKGKYGPFGDEIGMFFSSPASKGKIIGFHGRSGVHLDALGVHMEYS